MKESIRNKALSLGFSACGFTDANELTTEVQPLQEWLDKGYNASMEWMHNHAKKRLTPALLHPGTKTVIVVLMNYYPEKLQPTDVPQIAKYAYGKDYHDDMRAKLRELHTFINKITPCDGRAFVDSAPVLERALAKKAGLGWRGKNSLILTKQGAYFIIGELFIDIELTPDIPQEKSYCGTCTACIDACPTDAIVKDGVIDARSCLSYITIEHKGAFNTDTNLYNRAFGCDICLDVCPWNRSPKTHTNPHFTPHPDLITLSTKDFSELTREHFNEIFRKSAVKRTKYDGFMRNIAQLFSK